MSKITQRMQGQWQFYFEPEPDKPNGSRRYLVHGLSVSVYDEENGDWPWVDISTYGVPLKSNGEVDKRHAPGLVVADMRWRDRKALELAKEHKLFYLIGVLTHNQ